MNKYTLETAEDLYNRVEKDFEVVLETWRTRNTQKEDFPKFNITETRTLCLLLGVLSHLQKQACVVNENREEAKKFYKRLSEGFNDYELKKEFLETKISNLSYRINNMVNNGDVEAVISSIYKKIK